MAAGFTYSKSEINRARSDFQTPTVKKAEARGRAQARAEMAQSQNAFIWLLLGTATSMGTSAGLGYLQGYREKGMPYLGPVPLDALLGGGLVAAALVADRFIGVEGSFLLFMGGIGALNHWSANAGNTLGVKARTGAGTGEETSYDSVESGHESDSPFNGYRGLESGQQNVPFQAPQSDFSGMRNAMWGL